MDYIGVAYALTVAAGGLTGYMKAGSTASLASGLVFGAIAGYGAYQTGSTGSVSVMLVASGVLGGVMGARFYRSQKFMPAGLVFLLSVGMFGRSLYRTLA